MGLSLKTFFLTAGLMVIAAIACGLPGASAGLGGGDCPGIDKPAASGPGAYDGGDGYATTQKGPLTLGASCSGTIVDITSADNWTFDGKANQMITITVNAQGDADPNLTLIDPNGDAIAADDDSGGGTSPQLTITLPADGVYTLRVDMFNGGGYAISVK